MSTKTSNFEYTKPGVDEFYDVTEYNQTLDQIDADIQARKEAEELKAASGVYGHVKLSDSSAVTDSTGLALPATEKNASIEGTLANQISAIKYKSFSYEANGLTAYLRKVGRFIDCYIQGQAAQELATASGYATVCAINDDDFKVHPNCMFVQYVFLNNVHYGQCCFTTETALSIGYTKNMSGTSTNIAEGEYIYIHFQYPVSYKHIRAHETGRNLVCRIFIEKKKQ